MSEREKERERETDKERERQREREKERQREKRKKKNFFKNASQMLTTIQSDTVADAALDDKQSLKRQIF